MNHGHRRHTAGFSLVELMVALVAGMIVVGAVLAFTISSVRANSDYVKSTRLMQDLRNTGDFVATELKRAGYDESAMDYVANPAAAAASRFAPILVSNANASANCVLYAYDRTGGRPGKVDGDNGELRGVRRATTAAGVGVIEVAQSTGTVTPACDGNSPDYSQYPVTCNTTSGWCPLTDPRVLNISTFRLDAPLDLPPAGNNTHGIRSIGAVSGLNGMQLREIEMTLVGALTSDASVGRTVRSNIKVRADCLRALVASGSVCMQAPQITP